MCRFLKPWTSFNGKGLPRSLSDIANVFNPVAYMRVRWRPLCRRVPRDKLLSMSRKPLLWYLIGLPVWGQNANTPALEAQASALRALVSQAPKLALERTQIKIQSPAAGWEIGYPSSVTMDDTSTIY